MFRLSILLACVCILLPTPAHSRRMSLEKYYATSNRGHSYRNRVSYSRRHTAVKLRNSREVRLLTDKSPIPYLYATGNAVSDAFTGGHMISDRSCMVDGEYNELPRFYLHSTVR